MRPMRHSGFVPPARRIWDPPVVTKLAISGETKSTRENGRSSGLVTSGFDQPAQPPAPSATKFGFSFEMSFPLSARIEH